MVTGSMAMNYYAQPRMTRDIDVVIALEKSDTARLINLFSEEYYIDQQAVDRAITQRSIFNLIHQDSVIKVDAIVRKDDAYRKEEFARRQRVTIADFETWIVSLEDLILSKLYWARDSRSELQLEMFAICSSSIAIASICGAGRKYWVWSNCSTSCVPKNERYS